MKIYPGKIEEYVKRHNPIWDELKSVLNNHGVRNYSIFLEEENCILFGYAEIESEDLWYAIATTKICQKWWAYMQPLMETEYDGSPISINLKEVFHLD